MKWHVLSRPTKVGELNFDDLYEEISRDWQLRARDLRQRRLNKLREAA